MESLVRPEWSTGLFATPALPVLRNRYTVESCHSTCDWSLHGFYKHAHHGYMQRRLTVSNLPFHRLSVFWPRDQHSPIVHMPFSLLCW